MTPAQAIASLDDRMVVGETREMSANQSASRKRRKSEQKASWVNARIKALDGNQ